MRILRPEQSILEGELGCRVQRCTAGRTGVCEEAEQEERLP